jgi:hypothetical protein
MLYLAFISSDSLGYDFKLPLAVDISLAALLGEGIYNFAQLLMHPIVKVGGGCGAGVQRKHATTCGMVSCAAEQVPESSIAVVGCVAVRDAAGQLHVCCRLACTPHLVWLLRLPLSTACELAVIQLASTWKLRHELQQGQEGIHLVRQLQQTTVVLHYQTTRVLSMHAVQLR